MPRLTKSRRAAQVISPVIPAVDFSPLPPPPDSFLTMPIASNSPTMRNVVRCLMMRALFSFSWMSLSAAWLGDPGLRPCKRREENGGVNSSGKRLCSATTTCVLENLSVQSREWFLRE